MEISHSDISCGDPINNKKLRSTKKEKIKNGDPSQLPKKWRKRGRRPNHHAHPVVVSQTPTAFQLFGCNVEYRLCGTIVMFKTDHILQLTKQALGLKTDVAVSSPVGAILKHLRSASKYELLLQDQDQSWVRTHISWKAYRDLVDEGVYDVALKEMLKQYVPFEITKKTDNGLDQGPTLEQDCLKLADVNVPFFVHRGRIFLDLLASFTILGQLRLAFMNRWNQVDTILEEQGLNQKDAFRRNHKSRSKDRKWSSQRSHITFRAIKVLAENGLVEDSGRKRTLTQLFAHLESEVVRIGEMKQALLGQIEAKVKDLLKESGQISPISTGKKTDGQPIINENEDLIGTELCDSGCGRQYHFTLRCCSKSHQINLSGKNIGYIVSKGRIFLEKCGAFASLGRMYVIRCSDYRKSDKTLTSVGLKAKRHYLFERQISPEQNTHYKRRNRRTHISFEAFAALVNSGFADMARNKELIESVKDISSRIDELRKECLRFSSHGKHDSPSPISTPKQDSSSGIESGSSQSGSGSNSPVSFDDEMKPEARSPIKRRLKLQYEAKDSNRIKILGQSINFCVEGTQMYLSVSDVCQCLTDQERSLPSLKRMSKSLSLNQPFKKLEGKHHISLECLVTLLENKKIKPVSEEFEEQVAALLKGSKKQPETMSLESNEVDMEEDCDQNQTKIKENQEKPVVAINGIQIPVRVVNNCVYLEKKSVFKLLNINTPSHIAFRSIDKTLELEKVSVDDSFLYDGRRRSYMSTKALRVLAANNEHLKDIFKILDDLEGRSESFKINRVLKLSTFNDIPIKVIGGGSVFLCSTHLMSAVGFSQSYILTNPSKAYFVLVRLLKRRGLNTSACFLKWGKSKYAHISLFGAMTLFKTEFGPFRDKKRIDRLKEEILFSLKESGLSYQEMVDAEMKKKPEISNVQKPRKEILVANLGEKFPPIKYQVKGNVIFFHRKTCFEAIGVERALLSSSRGFAAINNILVCGRINLKECYIRGNQEQYAYISLQAIFVLLDSDDPLFACLEKKESFYESIFSWISSQISRVLPLSNTFRIGEAGSIPFKMDSNRLYFHRHTSFELSGLYEKRAALQAIPSQAHDADLTPKLTSADLPTSIILERGLDPEKVGFLTDGDDPYAYLAIDTLMFLTRLDSGIARASDYHKLIWKDMIQAVLHEVPKLKIHVKMMDFRKNVLASLLGLLSTALNNKPADSEDSAIEDLSHTVAQTISNNHVDRININKEKFEESDSSFDRQCDLTEEDTEMGTSEEDPLAPEANSELFLMSRSDYETAVMQVNGNPTVGDWTVQFCTDSEMKFSVNPGYGASKKPSFLQPDMWAILAYELRLGPEATPELLINGRRVPDEKLRAIFNKSTKKGLFNLLYTLLTLRPCFGAFNPELVETFEKNTRFQDLILDKKFIGSSQSGRTYAGCVRSKRCFILSESRVSDTCIACADLRNIVINRSVLASPEYESSSPQPQQSQLSVWKVEESSVDGCTFLCPQLQSFNTSLPHQFKSSNQASSVVSHRVHITNDFETKISLNQSHISGKIYPGDFASNKQIGPLLDWVASLRSCIGYPDPLLVDRARYLTMKKDLLPPETRKFFDYILVDENFEWKKMTGMEVGQGTLRTPSCRYVAGDFADICDQCRLLQEPLEFLGVKR